MDLKGKDMKVVVAMDSFKGCLSSAEVNDTASKGITKAFPDAEIIQVPVSDGGKGFLEAIHSAVGGNLIEVVVHDPLMRPIKANYLLKEKTAIIEIAQASGLTLLSEEERNPMVATSYGTGQLVADAVRRGAEHIIVGLGGSATSDAGIGMLRALVDAFSRHGTWDDIQELKSVRFTLASDVKNPLCGAAHVFAPQKGATSEMVVRLDERARRFAEVSARHFGFDRSDMEGAGAADGQTLMGKLPWGALLYAQGVPVLLIVGKVRDKEQLKLADLPMLSVSTHQICRFKRPCRRKWQGKTSAILSIVLFVQSMACRCQAVS